MFFKTRTLIMLFAFTAFLFSSAYTAAPVFAQAEEGDEESLIPNLPGIDDEGKEDEEEPAEEPAAQAVEEGAEEEEPAEVEEEVPAEEPEREEDIEGADKIEGGEAREGENVWDIAITIGVTLNYVFDDSPDSFTIRYTTEIKGTADAKISVIKGDAKIDASVEGYFSAGATWQCEPVITIPSVPFELTFRRTDDNKGNLKLVFKRAINEIWESKCTFKDAPGARFDTKGAPEKWLTTALEKARPPLKSIVSDLGNEATTTTFVISKQIIGDAPLGSAEIEGTGVITISPGGGG